MGPMRRLVIVPTLLAAAVVALPASAAQPPDPCVVITTVDASTVLGSNPPKAAPKTVGVSRSCTYTLKKKTMTVQTRRVPTQAAFDKSAKATKGVVFPMQGVGAPAYSVNGTTVLAWQNGTQVTITFAGVQPFVATQQALAKTAVGRL
jgi:hypothetical protein